MRFLEKDLETIIWENYHACKSKGLTINQEVFQRGIKYRQLNLAPYGIPDLVFICYNPEKHAYLVQVIELKKARIDSAAYLQACRYRVGMTRLIEQASIANNGNEGSPPNIDVKVVLIGDSVQKDGDFVFVLNHDADCQCFIYSYGLQGIEFKEVGQNWHMSNDTATASFKRAAIEIGAWEESVLLDYKSPPHEQEFDEAEEEEYIAAIEQQYYNDDDRMAIAMRGDYPEDYNADLY